jgi:hypothetical protein
MKTPTQDSTKDEHVQQKDLDFKDNVSRYVGLQDVMKKQNGPFEERAAWIMYDTWCKLGRLVADVMGGDRGDRGHGGHGDDGDSGAAGGITGGALGGVAMGDSQLPLDLLNMGLKTHRATALRSLAKTSPAILFYLRHYVFPRSITYHRQKLQASGMDIGSDTLFDTRLGFSGTPSNLLPPSLWPCKFQEGTQATVLGTLMDPKVTREQGNKGTNDPRDRSEGGIERDLPSGLVARRSSLFASFVRSFVDCDNGVLQLQCHVRMPRKDAT